MTNAPKMIRIYGLVIHTLVLLDAIEKIGCVVWGERYEIIKENGEECIKKGGFCSIPALFCSSPMTAYSGFQWLLG